MVTRMSSVFRERSKTNFGGKVCLSLVSFSTVVGRKLGLKVSTVESPLVSFHSQWLANGLSRMIKVEPKSQHVTTVSSKSTTESMKSEVQCS